MVAKHTPSRPVAGTARESQPAWSTTATAEWDAATAANDEAGPLSDHAQACKQSNGRLRPVVNALDRVHRLLQPRMVTMLVLIFVAAAAATLFLS